jgi:hypothetical protein
MVQRTEELIGGLHRRGKKLIDPVVGQLLVAMPCSNGERGWGGARDGSQSNLAWLTSDNFGGKGVARAEQRKRESDERQWLHAMEWNGRTGWQCHQVDGGWRA